MYVATGTAWATSQMNERMHRQQFEPPKSFTTGMPVKVELKSNFASILAVKTGMINVASHFCSHIGTVSQALPAAMLQVHRQHMRTRLNQNRNFYNLKQTGWPKGGPGHFVEI